MSTQAEGVHFINGPTAIPLRGYGRVTNDFPCPALVDMTVDSGNLPYGNLSTGSVTDEKTDTGASVINMLVGCVSGSWALHPAGDILLGSDLLPNGMINIGNVQVPGGSVSMLAAVMPFVVVGQVPTKVLDPAELLGNNSPTRAFAYSSRLMWIGRGSLGFGSVGNVGF